MTTTDLAGWKCGLCSALSSVEYASPPSPETTCVSCGDVANPCALLRAEVAALRGEVRELRRPSGTEALATSVTAPTTRVDEDAMTAEEVAKFLKLPTPKAVYAAARRGTIPFVRLGNRRLRFSRKEVEELLRKSA
jgi:excisionase family DNA binding protein